MRSAIGRYFRGDVSRPALLTTLLPLSAVSFFGTLMIGAALYPGGFDWRVRVISHVISPSRNPDAYWIPSLGMAVAALLALPFAGYVAQRLRPIAPRLARICGVGFALGFVLILSVAVPQQAQPTPATRKVHEVIARGSAIAICVGMICGAMCVLKDRLRLLGGRRSLNPLLALCWISVTLLPVCVGAVSGAVKLGKRQAWAIWVHDYLRDSIVWRLAFWEWIGLVVLFLFLFLAVLLLPEQIKAPQ